MINCQDCKFIEKRPYDKGNGHYHVCGITLPINVSVDKQIYNPEGDGCDLGVEAGFWVLNKRLMEREKSK